MGKHARNVVVLTLMIAAVAVVAVVAVLFWWLFSSRMYEGNRMAEIGGLYNRSDRITELGWQKPQGTVFRPTCHQPCSSRGFCTVGKAKYNKGLCCKGPWASRGFCEAPK